MANFRQILLHEGILTLKLTSITCVAQLCVQGLPLPQFLYSAVSWLIIITMLVIGAKSDVRFYRGFTINQIKWERLKSIFIVFLTGFTVSSCLVKYFGIHEAAFAPDPEILEANQYEFEGPDFFGTKLNENYGMITGITVLLFTHYLAILALLSLSRIALVLLQLILYFFASLQNKWIVKKGD